MAQDERIQPYRHNPWFWQYRGKPVILLGGSDEDNLFNHPDLPPEGLEAHLDRLVQVGGNYVRNTMSSRDEENLWPFYLDPATGLYDLNAWNDAYWKRFEDFLEATYARGIVVQIEVWDRFDFAREPWDVNPFNPKNNRNYTTAQSGLPEQISSHPGKRENPFFRTVPELNDQPMLRAYQEAFVSKMLSYSLAYPHVLYCISNETNESPLWGAYWATFLRRAAAEKGVSIEVTEMWDAWDIEADEHRATFDHPKMYSFVDISQNNHQSGERHWEKIQAIRAYLAFQPRPVNSVKVYGGDRHGGGLEEGTRKFWRNLFGGLAAVRFHRPTSGAGLSELAQTHLRSARMLCDRFDFMTAKPDNALLQGRNEDGAYCTAIVGEAYAVYFPRVGSVGLALGRDDPSWRLEWLEILQNKWHAPQPIETSASTWLTPPGQGQWVALVTRR